ncbi:nucleotidyltransferase domain-containing protein [Halobacillus halophilus]|uniref:nucleotidyltransferase domain-containing protein n=1 Tax=Halobacillus halophilus TaxID=1570 RepID=UPI001CD380B6|nr:nucleotidyltransferase domain-containing protein [Halobacillus halophilus]MCA1010615.1 nucleotidyltransferase domain-containing protein [Halobacillus halophilus]
MRQEKAVQILVNLLKEDPAVLSIFLKGSMGRNEHDQHSDIDLYCLVKEDDEKNFLSRRLDHLRAYKELMFYDDIFIIAPQIIAIYNDWLHVDLFTVTEKTFQNKDYFTVLYDPDRLMDKYQTEHKLTLSEAEFKDYVIDTAWFLFQYKKAKERGNAVWAQEMLRYVMSSLSNVMLYGYARDRSRLGLKAVDAYLPQDKRGKMLEIYECITPSAHEEAVKRMTSLLNVEVNWIQAFFEERDQTLMLLKLMIKTFFAEEELTS